MHNETHRIEPLFPIDRAWGVLRTIMADAANRHVLAIYESEEAEVFVHDGRVVHRVVERDDASPALSPDGTKLAVSWRDHERGGRYNISINGELAYRTDFTTVHYMDWIANDRLVWDGWNDSDNEGIFTFENGVDVTSRLKFQPCIGPNGSHLVRVQEGERRYTMFEDGRRGEEISVPFAESISYEPFSHEEWMRRKAEQADTHQDEQGGMFVTFRGLEGRRFEEVKELCYGADGARVGYVGMQREGFGGWLERRVGKIFERAEEQEGRVSKAPWWALPLALVFTPYGGPGHVLIERARRYYPVNHDRVWSKGYRCVSRDGLLFLADDRLAAVVVGGRRNVRMVIEEEEGPAFAWIEHPRASPVGSERLSYLAVQGETFVRVSVD